MVPKGWEAIKLNDICDKVTSGSRNWAQYYSEKGCKFIRMTNLQRNSIYLDLSDLKFVDIQSDSSDGQRTSLETGDILMSITAELGKIGWVHEGLGESFINQHTALIRLKDNQAYSKYIAYLLSSKEMNHRINRLNDSGAKAGLNLTTIRSISLIIPPILEQQKIANILSTWDKAISATERLIENSTQQKKALMQQLLTGKKRLLDESGKRFEGEWEEIELGDVCSRVMEKNNGQSTNVVTISAQQGLIKQEEFFKKSVASEILDNYYVLRKGQFAYNKSYSNGYPMGAIKRLNRYDDAVVTTLYICFEIKDHSKTDTDFLEQYFNSGFLNRGLTQVAAEGGRAHGLLNVKPSDFMALKFKLPTYREQQKIATVLTNADKEIELLKQQLADLQQEKKALMQVLLTGKKRVKT